MSIVSQPGSWITRSMAYGAPATRIAGSTSARTVSPPAAVVGAEEGPPQMRAGQQARFRLGQFPFEALADQSLLRKAARARRGPRRACGAGTRSMAIKSTESTARIRPNMVPPARAISSPYTPQRSLLVTVAAAASPPGPLAGGWAGRLDHGRGGVRSHIE